MVENFQSKFYGSANFQKTLTICDIQKIIRKIGVKFLYGFHREKLSQSDRVMLGFGNEVKMLSNLFSKNVAVQNRKAVCHNCQTPRVCERPESAYATGSGSTAMGCTTASGLYSTAMGWYSTANGSYSTAMGKWTTAQAFGSVTMGAYNVGGGNTTSWVATDPLFEVGNGSQSHKSDALLLDKSGNLKVNTVTVTAPGGDIPMYTGN